MGRSFLPLKANFTNAQIRSDRLQFAVVISLAGKAILRMIRQEQLHNQLARLANICRVGTDFHPLSYRVHTGSHERAGPLYFYQTNPA